MDQKGSSSQKSVMEVSTSNWSCGKSLRKPIVFSSSEEESPIVMRHLKLNSSKMSTLFITPDKKTNSRENLKISKSNNMFKKSTSDLNVNDRKGDSSYFLKNKPLNSGVEKDAPILAANIDHDRKFKTFPSRHEKFLHDLGTSIDDNVFAAENSISGSLVMKTSDIKTKGTKDQKDNVMADLTHRVTNSLNIENSLNTIPKKSFQIPRSLVGKKFKPIILVSDEESSSDELAVFPTKVELQEKPKQSFIKSLSPGVPAAIANQEGLKYRTEFKNRKMELTAKLFVLFNEKIFASKLPADMLVEWNSRLTKTAGYAHCRTSAGIKTCSISLSSKVVDSACRLRDTLMHEMCHAAVWIVHGVHEGHGPLWQIWAQRCTITFPEVRVPRRCHSFEINFKFTYRCTGCEYSIGRHSKSLNVEKYLCPCCNKKLELIK